MAKICNEFDIFFNSWHQSLWRLCFVITRGKAPAQELAFQALLRLGAAKEENLEENQAKKLLFERAVYLGTDYYIHKPHRLPKRENMGLPVSEGLYALMKLPLNRRCALCLMAEGFSPEQLPQLLHVRPSRAQSLCAEPEIPNWRQELGQISLSEQDAQALSDRVYERFAERSVGVENAIHAVRQGFDRIAPLLALAVLALFALSVWYVSRL